MNTSQYISALTKLEAFLKGESENVNMPEILGELHSELINQAIIKSKGNNSRAAKSLGIKRTALMYHLGYTPKRIPKVSDRKMDLND